MALLAWRNEHIPSDVYVEYKHIFHVTPSVCVPSIQRNGVDPMYANGNRKVSWWCEKQCLLWAIAHISSIKSISVDQLAVCAGRYFAGALKSTPNPGVFTCGFITIPNRVYLAREIFNWFTPEGKFING